MKHIMTVVFVLSFSMQYLPAQNKAEPAAYQYLSLPPSWSDRIIYYHGFDKAPREPEINLEDLKIMCTSPKTVDDGIFGKALSCDPKQPFRINGEALSVSKPLTFMTWWRLDEDMKEDTCFHLITLSGKGIISNFVRGKGEWCALKEPTYISQIHGFGSIPNHNNPWGGKAFFDKGQWHHCAISVGNANEVKIYWDGKLKEVIMAKGRKFAPDDVSVAEFGTNWLSHPMSIDEIIIVDRILSPDEISDYVKAVGSLSQHMKSCHENELDANEFQ